MHDPLIFKKSTSFDFVNRQPPNQEMPSETTMPKRRIKIALIHRYGLEGWICCGGHAVPQIVENLSRHAEIHFYGPQTTEPKNSSLRSKLIVHELLYRYDRSNPAHKYTRTLLWYIWLPLIGLRCRANRTALIWNDETVPWTAPILQLAFGKEVALTVMDFFARIYTEGIPHLRNLCALVEQVDLWAWRRLPLLFTKVLYTQTVLAKQGVPKAVMHLYRNPVDPSKFHPVDAATRRKTRAKFGFCDRDIVLTHHGILHPNKGNDWILERIAESAAQFPRLKLLLIGDGPEKDALEQQANALKLTNRIVFAGWLSTESELNDALASADLGLVMRIGQETDHFHMTDTLAHEMACAKPILAVDLHGIAEVIEHGQTGFLFSPGDPKTFFRALRAAVESTSKTNAVGARARALSRTICDPKQCAQTMANALRTCAFSSARGGGAGRANR